MSGHISEANFPELFAVQSIMTNSQTFLESSQFKGMGLLQQSNTLIGTLNALSNISENSKLAIFEKLGVTQAKIEEYYKLLNTNQNKIHNFIHQLQELVNNEGSKTVHTPSGGSDHLASEDLKLAYDFLKVENESLKLRISELSSTIRSQQEIISRLENGNSDPNSPRSTSDEEQEREMQRIEEERQRLEEERLRLEEEAEQTRREEEEKARRIQEEKERVAQQQRENQQKLERERLEESERRRLEEEQRVLREERLRLAAEDERRRLEEKENQRREEAERRRLEEEQRALELQAAEEERQRAEAAAAALERQREEERRKSEAGKGTASGSGSALPSPTEKTFREFLLESIKTVTQREKIDYVLVGTKIEDIPISMVRDYIMPYESRIKQLTGNQNLIENYIMCLLNITMNLPTLLAYLHRYAYLVNNLHDLRVFKWLGQSDIESLAAGEQSYSDFFITANGGFDTLLCQCMLVTDIDVIIREYRSDSLNLAEENTEFRSKLKEQMGFLNLPSSYFLLTGEIQGLISKEYPNPHLEYSISYLKQLAEIAEERYLVVNSLKERGGEGHEIELLVKKRDSYKNIWVSISNFLDTIPKLNSKYQKEDFVLNNAGQTLLNGNKSEDTNVPVLEEFLFKSILSYILLHDWLLHALYIQAIFINPENKLNNTIALIESLESKKLNDYINVLIPSIKGEAIFAKKLSYSTLKTKVKDIGERLSSKHASIHYLFANYYTLVYKNLAL